MASESLAEELDFEDDTQNEPQDDEFYCSVCSDCYDEAKEFIDHINSSEHLEQCNEKLSSLVGGDKYCSICLTKAEPTFEAHCSSSDHCQFFDSLHRSMPETASPSLKIVEVKSSEVPMKKPPSRTVPLRKKDISCKMIGLNYIKKKDDNFWFCNICLDKFTSVEAHCSKAMHAIQCIKICDPDLAYEIKVSANQKGQKKIVSSIISSKVEEIYEKEKDTPEYIKTMLELEGLNPTVVQDDGCKEELDQQEQAKPEVTETLVQSEEKDVQSQEEDVAPSTSNSQDMGEMQMVSLFEEEDRSFIPVNDEVESRAPIPSREATMIVGVGHLKLKGRSYYCGLCDIMCKTTLESCKLHITSSLHRRRMINKFSAHPIPNYLEKLRTKDATLYNKLIRIETMKIELNERKNESFDDRHRRAGILGIKKVEMLPEPLLNVRGLPSSDKSLNLMELAKQWDSENNATVFQKSAKDTPSAGSNKSTISPIQPLIENILVGVKTVSHVKDSNFHCGLCNIKFDVKNKRNDKHHVNGRLHKKKALVAAYGRDVEAYLQHRSRKDGYDALNRIINQACVPLEKEEVESESPASREIRAQLLGVKVEQLPLPMIIMFSNAEAFDIKMAINDWKGGKKSSVVSSKVVTSDASKESSSSSVKKSVADKESEHPVAAEVKIKPAATSADTLNSDQLAIQSHRDPQSFEQQETTFKNSSETGKSPGARNIFDLCKPMPDASPDKPVFKTLASASHIKNIDIDGLRKSLVDAELGEFVPVAKAIPENANPEADNAGQSKRKLSSEEETPKTSLSEEEIKRRKSSENVSTEAKKRLAESIKSELKKSTPIKSSNDRSTSHSSSASPARNDTGARRTYQDVSRVRNVHQSSKPPMNRTKPQGHDSSNNSSNRQNQMPPHRNQTSNTSSSRPSQLPNQRSMSTGRNDFRGQPRGNPSKNQERDTHTHRDSDVSRNNNAGRDNNRYRGAGGDNYNTRNHRGGNSGSNFGRNNVASRDQNSARGNDTRMNTNNYGNRGNDSHSSHHRNQGSGSPRFAKAFDIDVGSMKNTNLSSALARVTNIAPISQACSAKINEVAQNLRSNNPSGNFGNFNGFPSQPTQAGPNPSQQNYPTQHSNQFQGNRQGNNQGFNHGNSQSNNSFVNQGNFHNQAGGYGNNNGGNPSNSWNNNNNNNQYGGGYGGNHASGNNNYGSGNGGNRGGGNNDFVRNNGRGQVNQFNDSNMSNRRNNFQNNSFGNDRGGFNGGGKRSNNNVQDSTGYNDRQKRQRNNHFNR